MKHLTLGTKLLIGGILVVAIPIIVIGMVSVYQATEITFNDKKEDMAIISESLAGALEVGMHEQLFSIKNRSYSNSIIAAAEKLAKEGEAKSRQEMALAERELIKIKKAEGDRLSSINIVGKNGIFLVSSDNKTFKGTNISKREYFTKALNGTPNIGSVVVSVSTGRVVCTSASPIYSSTGKDIIGVVTMALELKYFSDFFEKMKIGKAGYAYIVDKSGFYITHPVKDKILKENISQIKGMEAVSEMVKQGKSGMTEYTLEGIRKMAAVSPVPITGWSVVSTVPVAELYAPARFTRNVILTIGIIFLLLASVFFYFFARSLTLPLINVVEAAQKIAGGNLAVEVTSEARQDEIGILARAFSTMVEKLRGQIQQIIEGVNILASAGSEIMASVSQLTSGASETATSVSETTTTVEEVKQTAVVTSQKAKHVSELGQRTAEISRAGLKSIEDTVNGMNRIREQMESIADMVVRLSEQSQAIGEIIATVNDIAEQSNLLAVNASIEAAKAGEQGKGFAVVAQEIRSLAAQSKQATTQVRNILFDVQKAIGSAVMATEQGSKAVEEGVKLSTQAGESIDILAESVTEATNAAIQIAASSQQQLIGMDQVVSAMESIREASAQTASGTKQTERAAHDLHNLGQRLQEIVKFYKV